MISVDLIVTIPQQPALHITKGYARFGQGVEANINVTCKLRVGW